MYYDSRMSRCVAIILIALFSLALASCGGGGGGGSTGATSYTVSTTAGADGSISPASATVNSGATTSFTVTPGSGNSINTVTGCGGALVGNTYTTGAITAACTVTASFVSNSLPTISVADASVNEGDSGTTSLNFTVTLSAPSSSDVGVDYATSDNSPAVGGATAGSDYTAVSTGTLTIPAGNTSGTVTVDVTGDTTVESDETLTLTLSNPTGVTLGTAIATGTITNDDSVSTLPTISIANASVTEGDSGITSLNFTVTLSVLASSDVSVGYATSDNSPAAGSAIAGSDYTAINTGILIIPAGNTSGTVTVDVAGDTTVENDETLTLTLSNPTGATLGTATAAGTISNDDSVPLPTISIADASVTEGDRGTTNLNFTVTLSALANGNVNVDYATSDSSATTADNDYTAMNGTLTIPAASLSTTVSISILRDKYIESDETLTLTLSNPSANVTLASFTATGTILNDDVPSLNDTGITLCSDGTTDGFTCPQTLSPGQDAEFGRDATVNDDSDGNAGFSFTKLDSSGNPLTDQTVAYSMVSWDCVQDNVTSLTWEVKTTDGGLRDTGHTYTWYNSTGINDGGSPGYQNAGTCVDSNNCDTEKYVAAVNAVALCGRNDWRMPTVSELLSLVDGSVAIAMPFDVSIIDATYFPNTALSLTWTSSPLSVDGRSDWVVHFNNGRLMSSAQFNSYAVRLVRDDP